MDEATRLAERKRVDTYMAEIAKKRAAAAAKKSAVQPTAQQLATKRNEQRIMQHAPTGWQRLLQALGLQ